MQKKYWIATFAAAVALGIGGMNYFGAYRPAAKRLAEDSRNSKLSFWFHYRYGVAPGTLVVDLRSFDDEAAMVDIMRALLHSAEGHKGSNFDRVVLEYRGTPKFMLDGSYFRKLGEEFEHQNPIYTLRTFPGNVYKLDGSLAYGQWTGGWLGVVGKQMEDLNQFAKDWYLDDALRERAPS